MWLFALIFGSVGAIGGNKVLFDSMVSTGASWYSIMNLFFLLLVLFVIAFTNMRAAGSPAINIALLAAVAVLLVYLFGGNTAMLKNIPAFLVFMNSNFYFTFGIGLLIIWVFSITIYDRRKTWLVRPRRFTEYTFPNTEDDFLMDGFRLKGRYDDIVCHTILGLGFLGDISVTAKDHEPIRHHQCPSPPAQAQ